MAVASLAVTAVTIHVLYGAAYHEVQTRLIETAQSQARLIEAIARFNMAQAKARGPRFINPGDATMGQILDAHSHYRGFGKTGEFTLAHKVGNQIVFLLRHRHDDLEMPRPVPFESELAEPMRLALLGNSGTIKGLDYRGQTVLAAYEPVNELNMGIVAKIDMSEVRKPFLRAAGLALIFTLAVVLAGATLFIKITNPLIKTIRESEDYMKSIFKVAPVGIGVVSNRILKRVNNRMCEMVGYSPEQLIGQSARIIYPDEKEFERVGKEKYAEIERSGTGVIQTRWIHQNGHIIDVLLSSTPIDPADREAGVTFTALDITERIKAEQDIRDSHETLLAVLDSIDAAIYAADMKTHEILFVNKTTRDTFGRDLVGDICWKSFRNESGPCRDCNNNQLLDDSGMPTGVISWEGRNPITGKWYINYDRAIRWVDGRFVRLQVAINISKIKELEEGRRQTEAQLLQAQKMEAIGTLAGGIAHDFNNILGVIVGNTELAMMEVSGNDSIGHNLTEIHEASIRARDLVKQILTFSRQSEHEMIPLLMSSIVKEVLKMLRSTLPATIEIKQFIDPSAGIVVADPTQIHQILMNLSTNAGYSMRESGGILTIRLENVRLHSGLPSIYPELDPGTYISLTVSDTGTGIDPTIIKRIFDPYFTTKPLGEGTGMGLALVHGIVKRCGGTISVESKPGKGTTFTLLFPRVESRVKAAHKTPDDIPHGHETILFVDDEDAIVEMAIFMLKRLGYTVIGKTSSIKALETFQETPEKFDLVITDQTMPKMTGEEFSQELMSVRPDIPIILCTGFSEVINEERTRAIGIREFILKPILMTDLAKVIRRLLDEETERDSGHS